jgi:transposase-like protein
MNQQSEIGLPSASLIAGRDFPNTYREFVSMFPDNEACKKYLRTLRWPNTFICPICGIKREAWIQTRNRMVCSSCRHQASVTAKTIFDKTRTPLTTWFEAAWHMTTAKNGMSAKTLQRTLGTSYRAAWTMLQRYRVAMVRPNRSLLTGNVEVDETLIGGAKQNGKRGRGAHKNIVVIAIEVKSPKGFGRVRMRNVPNASESSLVPFVRETVKAGATVLTDGWRGYNDLPKYGYTHKKVVLSDSGDPAHVSLPGVHRIASLLKRWMLGTHQGSFDSEHLQAYLEEFTFRFNRRTSRSRGLVFRRLLEQAVVTGPITDADVTSGYAWKCCRRS